MTLKLAIIIRIKPGQRSQQVDAFNALAPLVRAEAGCIQYNLHAVADDPNRFVLLEEWQSQAHLDAHDASPHMVEADAANKAFRDGPVEVLVLTPVE